MTDLLAGVGRVESGEQLAEQVGQLLPPIARQVRPHQRWAGRGSARRWWPVTVRAARRSRSSVESVRSASSMARPRSGKYDSSSYATRSRERPTAG